MAVKSGDHVQCSSWLWMLYREFDIALPDRALCCVPPPLPHKTKEFKCVQHRDGDGQVFQEFSLTACSSTTESSSGEIGVRDSHTVCGLGRLARHERAWLLVSVLATCVNRARAVDHSEMSSTTTSESQFQPKHEWEFKNNILSGITLDQWLSLLWRRRRDVDWWHYWQVSCQQLLVSYR